MNRLTNYMESQKLAKQFLNSAENAKELEKAFHLIARSLHYQMTACNNLASLLFERKRSFKKVA